jgi:Leucine-rich repeat (LRR) protein
MEIGPPPILSSRNLLRSEENRLPRSFRLDDHDRPRAASENRIPNGSDPDLSTMLDDSPPRADENSQAPKAETPTLSPDETTELFKRKVANARQDNEQALESEGVVTVVKPKLTLDLGHCNIARLPETVVELIRDEVDRLSLSHNQLWYIPPRFSECNHLRYLNIRSNVFREIPRGVYKLPLLEILDISRNKVKKISKDIKNLTSLRVFAVVHNRVDDLPTELCEMNKLQILKIAENPLRFKLKKIVEQKENEVSFSEMTDNEREAAITVEIKRFLRESHPVVPPIDVDVAQELNSSPLETPRPTKRTLSSRFPVIPSTASGDSSAEGNKSFPNQGGPPPVPARSHYRMSSGTGMAIKRPSISPLISSSERNRSNSESVLQATAPSRTKRMGMLRTKTGLDSIDENKSNRNSHLRGFSHASALKPNGVPASPDGGGSSSSPSSPREARARRHVFVKRLSSLPEHKVENEWQNPIIESAKGILYALYQIHPQLSGLIAAVKGKEARRSSVEITFYNASTHVDQLNKALEHADAVDPSDGEAVDKAEKSVQHDCATCIMAYIHVSTQLQDNVRKIVAGSDARYVRTLLLLLYGSIIEIRNAINSFGVDIKITSGHKRQRSIGGRHAIQTIPEEFSTPDKTIRSATPTRDEILHQRPVLRQRSDTTIQRPAVDSHAPLPMPMDLTGTTVNGSVSNHSTTSTINAGSTGFRSRSSSRNTGHASTNNSSFSSVASTPRSGDGFNLTRSNAVAYRVNPLTGMTDAQEEAAFASIFMALTRAYEAALKAVPLARDHFARCLEAAEENRHPSAVHNLWIILVQRCKQCYEVSEALQLRLTNMRKDVDGRNDPSFWLLCTTFLQHFVALVNEMREVRNMRLLPQELIVMLRPVQKASREAGRLMESSPWKNLADGISMVPAPTPYTSAMGQPPHLRNGDAYGSLNGSVFGATGHNGHAYGLNGSKDTFSTYSTAVTQHHATMNGVTSAPAVQPISTVTMPPGSASLPLPATLGSASMHGPSPVTSPLPATLGPAAQATIPNSVPMTATSVTVPNTPATATNSTFGGTISGTGTTYGGDHFFKGDVFQRADSLLSMPQAGGGIFFTNNTRRG